MAAYGSSLDHLWYENRFCDTKKIILDTKIVKIVQIEAEIWHFIENPLFLGGHFGENPRWRPPEVVLTISNVINGFRDTTNMI